MDWSIPVTMHKCGHFVHAPMKRTTFLCCTCLHSEIQKSNCQKIFREEENERNLNEKVTGNWSLNLCPIDKIKLNSIWRNPRTENQLRKITSCKDATTDINCQKFLVNRHPVLQGLTK